MTTTVFGPWGSIAARDRVYAELRPAVRARARRARYGGVWWLEIWPEGSRLGATDVARSWPPDVGSLPPLIHLDTPNQGYRGAEISGVVIHETEGGYAGAVSWLRNPAARASAHVVIREDGRQAAQLVPFSRKAWHAADANPHTIGIEIAGWTARANDARQVRAAARVTAMLCARYRIPARQGDEQGRRGITTHRALGQFGGGHTDPGGFSWPAFLSLVGRELRRGRFPREWGRS